MYSKELIARLLSAASVVEKDRMPNTAASLAELASVLAIQQISFSPAEIHTAKENFRLSSSDQVQGYLRGRH